MLNIHSKSVHPVEKGLSNYTPRTFEFDGVVCTCVEVVLQAFKIPDQEIQKVICRKTAKQAQILKKTLDTSWQKNQTLHWQGVRYKRGSLQYAELLTRLFDVVFEQCDDFRDTLTESIGEEFRYDTGKYEQTKTVLTIPEFITQLERLREYVTETK